MINQTRVKRRKQSGPRRERLILSNAGTPLSGSSDRQLLFSRATEYTGEHYSDNGESGCYLFTGAPRAILIGMNEDTANESLPHSLKVFLVEDSKALADRLGDAISHISGVHLIGVADTEAVAIAVAHKDVDVMVLDLHLKQGTGFGVMRALATARSKPIIVVFTNFDSSAYKQAALAYGADYFLDKARDFARLPGLLIEIRNQLAAVH